MANGIKPTVKIVPEVDKIYTPALIMKAKGKLCNICNQYITDDEAESKAFHYSKTKNGKNGTNVFIHKTCWDKYYGKGGI